MYGQSLLEAAPCQQKNWNCLGPRQCPPLRNSRPSAASPLFSVVLKWHPSKKKTILAYNKLLAAIRKRAYNLCFRHSCKLPVRHECLCSDFFLTYPILLTAPFYRASCWRRCRRLHAYYLLLSPWLRHAAPLQRLHSPTRRPLSKLISLTSSRRKEPLSPAFLPNGRLFRHCRANILPPKIPT